MNPVYINQSILQNPLYNKVKTKKSNIRMHDYVLPFNGFYATNDMQPKRRFVKNHTQHQKKRMIFPPSIKEEEDEEGQEDDEENIPLALLAYKKGYSIVPDKRAKFQPLYYIHPQQKFYQLNDCNSSFISLPSTVSSTSSYSTSSRSSTPNSANYINRPFRRQ